MTLAAGYGFLQAPTSAIKAAGREHILMTNKKIRVKRARQASSNHERTAFPMLLVLVMVVIVLGMFFYTGLLVAGSVIFAGFFGWLWWKRRAAVTSPPKKKAPARRKPKPRTR